MFITTIATYSNADLQWSVVNHRKKTKIETKQSNYIKQTRVIVMQIKTNKRWTGVRWKYKNKQCGLRPVCGALWRTSV